MHSSASCSKRSATRARRLMVATVVVALTTIGVVLGAAPSGAAPADTTAKGGACRLPYEPGQHALTLTSGGLQRTVVVYVPSGYDGRHRLPLALTLHGSQSTAVEQLERSELAATAERHDFIVAAPQGYLPAPPGYRWNVPGVTLPAGEPPDDEQFLSDAIAYLTANLCIDLKQVYGTGYSGGGRMISQYACDFADRLAAIAPVAGLRAGYPITGPSGPVPDPATCTPSRPMPVIAFAGTADPVNPYAGGGAPYWQYGTETALARWAELNHCRQARVSVVTEHVSKVSYFACRRHAEVVLYRVTGGGHTWPGSEAFIPLEPFLGPVTFEIDASELIWRFFDRHRLPGPPHK
jgi:polyhydroxybutyrate depolymerase